MEAYIGNCWNCKTRSGLIHCDICQFGLYCDYNCLLRDQHRHKIECQNAVLVKSCHNCSKFGKALKCCKGCYSAFYCNAQCQSLHWARHKATCVETSKHILHCAAVRQQLPPFAGLPWMVGATLAEDYLCLAQNEGMDSQKNVGLMFIGVGDIRDVACTIARLPFTFKGKLEFVLNDISPHIMARNLIFLYCAIKQQNAAYLIQIWYSIALTEDCMTFLLKILNDLVSQPRTVVLSSMHNLVDISEEHWQSCLGIWEAWIRLSKEIGAFKRLQNERMCKLDACLIDITMMYQLAPQEHVESLKDFINNGILLPINSSLRNDVVHANPTMACINPFNPNNLSKYDDVNSVYPHCAGWGYRYSSDTEMMYGVRQDCYAFVCWDYQDVKKTVGLKDDLMDMYQRYLMQIFTDVFRSLNKKRIHIQLVVGSFEIMDDSLLQNKLFDRICTSNLSDYVPIPRLLKQFGPFLNRKNPHSVLISHHQNWGVYSKFRQMDVTYETVHSVLSDSIFRPEVMPTQQELENGPLALASLLNQSGYVNVYPSFAVSCIAEVLLYLHDYENVPFAKSSLAKVSTIPRKFGLRLRDYRKEINHVVPFYRNSFARRIEFNRSAKRCLEWVPV